MSIELEGITKRFADFVAVDNDRYTINGEYRQIMLSARELNSQSLPNRTWVNERLTFTHGYGVVVGPPPRPARPRSPARPPARRRARRRRR